MKKEDLFEMLEDIDPASVRDAGTYRKKKKIGGKQWIAVAACLTVLIGSIFGIPAIKNSNGGIMTVMAAYPDPLLPGMSTEEGMFSDAYRDWQFTHREKVLASGEIQEGLSDYYLSMMNQLLVSDTGNTVCSPLNTYIASAMLAEVSDGNTRQQILNMLGAKDMEELRNGVSVIWEANYVDTPMVKSILANSIWLNDEVKYNGDVLKRLAQNYYASSFSGEMGSEKMNEALQKWTDDNTRGALSEYTKDMSMDPDTVLEIVSTVYYKAMWAYVFSKQDTKEEIFHGISGDTTAQMMKKSEWMGVYRTDEFTSVPLHLSESGTMYFFLPNEGVDVNTLASNPDIFKMMKYDENDTHHFSAMVHMSVPKFRVSNKVDMLDALRNLGVTDAMNPDLADFSPLTVNDHNLYLSKANHAAMVEIDEEGVTGAAYTDMGLCGAGLPPDEEIDFVLDRPFMFMVTAQDGSILFSGIIRNIE